MQNQSGLSLQFKSGRIAPNSSLEITVFAGIGNILLHTTQGRGHIIRVFVIISAACAGIMAKLSLAVFFW